jgi:exonuclease VII large subunit
MHGKAINKASQLKPGDEIETRLSEGTIKSVVK